jgi:hypothetical protein
MNNQGYVIVPKFNDLSPAARLIVSKLPSDYTMYNDYQKLVEQLASGGSPDDDSLLLLPMEIVTRLVNELNRRDPGKYSDVTFTDMFQASLYLRGQIIAKIEERKSKTRDEETAQKRLEIYKQIQSEYPRLRVVKTYKRDGKHLTDLKLALVGLVDMAEANEICEKYGVSLVELCKRNSHKCYERLRDCTLSGIDVASILGDGYIAYTTESSDGYSYFDKIFKPRIASIDNIYDLTKAATYCVDIISHLQLLDDDTVFITQMCNGKYELVVGEYPKQAVEFSHGGYDYAVGIIVDLY